MYHDILPFFARFFKKILRVFILMIYDKVRTRMVEHDANMQKMQIRTGRQNGVVAGSSGTAAKTASATSGLARAGQMN